MVKGVPARVRRPRSPFNILRRTGTRESTQPDSESTVAATTTSRGDRIEKLWILSVVGYTVLRFVIAWGAFGDHGANVWIFGFVDIATAVPYAKAVSMVCRRAAAFDWKRLPLPIAIALVSFFAPYGYLWFAAGSMPGGVRIGLVVCVTVLAAAATIGVITKVRKLRAAELIDTTGHSPVTAPPVTASPVAANYAVDSEEVVIDLTRGGAHIYTRSRIAS